MRKQVHLGWIPSQYPISPCSLGMGSHFLFSWHPIPCKESFSMFPVAPSGQSEVTSELDNPSSLTLSLQARRKVLQLPFHLLGPVKPKVSRIQVHSHQVILPVLAALELLRAAFHQTLVLQGREEKGKKPT